MCEDAGLLANEKRGIWHKSSKETAKREEEVLAMSEELQEHVEEARKMKEEFKEDVEEWGKLCECAELDDEAKRSLDDILKRSSQKDQKFPSKPIEKQGKCANTYGSCPSQTEQRRNTHKMTGAWFPLQRKKWLDNSSKRWPISGWRAPSVRTSSARHEKPCHSPNSERPPSLIDVKGLGRPKEFMGKEGIFQQWPETTDSLFAGVIKESRMILKWSAEQVTEITVVEVELEFTPTVTNTVRGVPSLVFVLQQTHTSLMEEESETCCARSLLLGDALLLNFKAVSSDGFLATRKTEGYLGR